MNRIYILLLLLVCSNVINARVIEVSGSMTIKEALLSANDYDTVLVTPGFYTEGELKIKKKITLLGKDYPVLDGQGKYQVLTVLSDSVTVSGLKIQNIGVSYTVDRSAIRVVKKQHCIIENNIINDAFFGIYLERCKNILVKGNTVIGKAVNEMSSGNAIHLWYCKNIKVTHNIAKNHRDGIYLEFVTNSEVLHNHVEDNIRYGLHFMFSNHDKYLHNKFISNGAGVAVMFSKHVLMRNNIFSKNWGSSAYGLLLKEITDSEIHKNTFEQNTIAIYSEGSNRINIHQNNFSSNGWAIKMMANCTDCKVVSNNFLNNTMEITTNGTRNSNIYEGNYWSQYSGYDIDKDGIADVPYRPVKLFSYLIVNVNASTILMRSMLVDLINFAEKMVPVITPGNLKDNKPMMKKIKI